MSDPVPWHELTSQAREALCEEAMELLELAPADDAVKEMLRERLSRRPETVPSFVQTARRRLREQIARG